MDPQDYMASQPKQEKVFNAKKIVGIVLVVVLVVVLVAAGIVFAIKKLNGNNSSNSNNQNNTPTTPVEPEEPKTPEKIDFQLITDQWITTQGNSANFEVMIYDLDNSEIVARHNEDKPMYIASIYKMFVAYEGYYRIDHNIWDGNGTYGLGKDIEGNQFTRSKCLDYMIRYSYSPCAETMWNEIGHDKLQAIYNEKGYKNTNIAGITSTPSDLVKLYREYYKHTDLTDESWEKIQDSMLNQEAPRGAASVYAQDWRKGLPAGFSTAKVYDKVGWWGDGKGNWYYYADAAFVTFPEAKDKDTGKTRPERHYIVIVLTKSSNPAEIVKFGRKIEETVKTTDNYI